MNNVRPATHKIISYTEITSNAILANYNSLLDYDTCLNHGIDYNKLITQNNNSKIDKHIDVFQDVSVIIAALVTSFARVYLNNIILNVLNKGGNIYYMDTDSLVTDIPLDDVLIGKNIGQFKLEKKDANKTYCLLLKDGTTIIKAKGANAENFTLKDYYSMYYNNNNIMTNKTQSLTDLSQGSVVIQNQKVLLNPDVYLINLCFLATHLMLIF